VRERTIVDFNNITSTGIPAAEIERINVLHKRENVIIAIEDYKSNIGRGVKGSLCYVKARLNALFNQCYGMLRRQLTKTDTVIFDKLKETPDKDNVTIKELEECFYTISELLDKLKITRIDNQPIYNIGNVIEANYAKSGDNV
jgi:hypothetical protein